MRESVDFWEVRCETLTVAVIQRREPEERTTMNATEVIQALHDHAKAGSGLARSITARRPDDFGLYLAMLLHSLSGILLAGDLGAVQRAAVALQAIAGDIFEAEDEVPS